MLVCYWHNELKGYHFSQNTVWLNTLSANLKLNNIGINVFSNIFDFADNLL